MFQFTESVVVLKLKEYNEMQDQLKAQQTRIKELEGMFEVEQKWSSKPELQMNLRPIAKLVNDKLQSSKYADQYKVQDIEDGWGWNPSTDVLEKLSTEDSETVEEV